MTLNTAEKVYFIGIRGVGMSALACALQDMGKQVLGSDVSSSHDTPTGILLSKRGIKVYEEFSQEHIDDSIDYVIIPALFDGPSNIEAKKAYKLNIESASFAKAVGIVMSWCKTGISVCGTHGKTTTSAMIANLFKDLNLKSTHLVGTAEFNNGIPGGGYTGDDYCVCEADEYVTSVDFDKTPKLLHQNPSHIICTNIDFDHPDVFGSLDEIKGIFETFFRENIGKSNGRLFYCIDNNPLFDVVNRVGIKGTSFGLSSQADYQAKNIKVEGSKFIFDVFYQGNLLTNAETELSGEHNISNMTGVIALAHTLGFQMSQVTKSLRHFAPAQRRLQKLYENRVIYFDDYAHHPTEIQASLKALKLLYPKKKIIVIFEPHTVTRTYMFKNEFIESLALADRSLILPVYTSVREKQGDIYISSQELVNLSKEKNVGSLEFVEMEDVLTRLLNEVKSGDLVVTVGAGDKVYFLRKKLIKLFKDSEL